MILFIRCADSDVAVCRAAISGCSEPHSASGMSTTATCCLVSSPLPDRNGRKLVDDWGGTTRVSFRLMLLISDCTIPYTSAEIPPAGAPSGFDSAAMIGFGARRCTVVPLRSE